MTKVFISYCGQDRLVIKRLVLELERNAVSVWFDRKTLVAGYRWENGIRRGVSEADYFLACFSRNFSAHSDTFMKKEIQLAIKQPRMKDRDVAWLIPVRLEDCLIPDISIGNIETLNSLQWFDLFPAWNDGILSLLSLIEPASAELTAEQRVEETIRSQNTTINLSGLGLKVFPECLRRIPFVREIDLSHNAIAMIPDWVSGFRKLSRLDIQYNKLSIFPEPLVDIGLEELDISGNQITSLPGSLGRMSNLNTLICFHLKLDGLPSCLFQMVDRGSLRRLNLEYLESCPQLEDAIDSADAMLIALNYLHYKKRK